MIRISPAVKSRNMSPSIPLTPFPAPLNSFQMNTPHKAPIMVAPCPSPNDMAYPALLAANKLRAVPSAQISPPMIPER